MRLTLNESVTIPRPLFLDESTGNLRPAEKASYAITPPSLAYIDADTFTATGLAAGEGTCVIEAELAGVKLSKTVPVIVPAPQTVEVPVTVEVPGSPPPFNPTKLVIPGESN